MARYDYHCSACDITMEHTCPIAERESQTCIQCGAKAELLFSPPTQIVIPRAFGAVYSDLFGTSSEKEYRKEHPELEVISPSRTTKSDRQKRKEERDKIIAEGRDIENTLKARGQLKRYDVEAGSMPAEV